MTAEAIWIEFTGKLTNDSLRETGFHPDTRCFLLPFLSGVRRDKFINSSFKTFDGETKKCVVLDCPDGEYRFDFAENDGGW